MRESRYWVRLEVQSFTLRVLPAMVPGSVRRRFEPRVFDEHAQDVGQSGTAARSGTLTAAVWSNELSEADSKQAGVYRNSGRRSPRNWGRHLPSLLQNSEAQHVRGTPPVAGNIGFRGSWPSEPALRIQGRRTFAAHRDDRLRRCATSRLVRM